VELRSGGLKGARLPGIPHQAPHLQPVAEQRAGEPTPDEAGRPRDQDLACDAFG
jgi:hypothetical protein